MTENSLRMRVMAYLSQVKANLLTETIFEMNEDKKQVSSFAQKLEEKNRLLEDQKKIIEEKNKELQKQTNIAQNATKYKGIFLANMSHEIRTPLNAILGFIDLLKNEVKSKDAIQYVNIIDKSSKSLLQIIEDILDISKIESGKLNIDKIFFNPYEEFKMITDLFGGKCSQKDILLNVNIDKTLPESIKTDPLRIKQIISNLLSNAAKFTETGKNIFVNIYFKDNMLNVLVKDEGIGISEDKLEHVFEAFSQEDSSTTRKYGGTGLGLAICSELVRLLGGELKVKSRVGIGSEFYFFIPVESGRRISEKSTSNKCINMFDNEKILVAEDIHANQMFMKVILKKLNFQIDIANDGLEAIKKFKTNKYDAVLMDENMPNMSGIEATKHILEYEKENDLVHTPIIALTANALVGDKERFLKAGMDEYLTKPLDKNSLVEILDKLLSRQS
jgi:signal transduction histidine kinase/ActR/RegA family two-component response regulator